MRDDSLIRTITEMSDEKVQPAEIPSEETGTGENTSGEKSGLPRRYKLYDKFADNVSLSTINGVIIITAVLIVGFLIFGIATGGH